MEVHAHSHTARKKWTHYFWEFLMLFLAVFCGFYAEYQLEHKIEKDRARQYIRSFYNDLKTDTSEFTRLVAIYERKKQVFSGLDDCFDSLSLNTKMDNTCLRNLVRETSGFPDMVNADQTMLQLKNAGGLRLLGKEDADSILVYDKQLRAFHLYESTGFQERQYRMRDFFYDNLKYKTEKQMSADLARPLFITNDPVKINSFFVMAREYALASNYHLRSLKKLNAKADNLIGYFREKYDFE